MGKGSHDADKLAKCATNASGQRGEAQGLRGQVQPGGGGTVQPVAEGGSFYTDADGGKVFITNGGKVFG